MDIHGRTIELSKQDKVLFPEAGVTKGDLVEYYRRVADVMLPHLAGRPLTLQRFPDGIGEGGFYQKDASDYFPDWIRRAKLPKEGGTVDYVVADDAATLVYLANQAVVTLHSFLSLAARPKHPDRLVFDLDPGRGDDFDTVRDAARRLRDALAELSLTPYVQTTGSRGLHVVVPLDRSVDFDAVRSFARDVARRVVSEDEERLTVEARKEKRRGRVYIDVMRNAYGQTMVTPYAVRPRPKASVATPLDWSEVSDSSLEPDGHTVKTLFRRLGQKEDPWKGMSRDVADLKEARERLDARR